MADVKKISTDAATVAVLSKLDDIFTLEEQRNGTEDFSAAWLN